MSKWRKTIWNVSTTAMESHTQQQAERTSDGREEPEEDKVKSLKKKISIRKTRNEENQVPIYRLRRP